MYKTAGVKRMMLLSTIGLGAALLGFSPQQVQARNFKGKVTDSLKRVMGDQFYQKHAHTFSIGANNASLGMRVHVEPIRPNKLGKECQAYSKQMRSKGKRVTWVETGVGLIPKANVNMNVGPINIGAAAGKTVALSMRMPVVGENWKQQLRNTPNALRPPISEQDLKSTPRGFKGTYLVSGDYLVRAGVGRNWTLISGKAGNVGAHAGASLAISRNKVYEVVVERRGSADAYLSVMQLTKKALNARLGVSARANPDLGSLLPSIGGSLGDRAMDMAVGKAEKTIRSYAKAGADITWSKGEQNMKKAVFQMNLNTNAVGGQAQQRENMKYNNLGLNVYLSKMTVAQRISNSNQRHGTIKVVDADGQSKTWSYNRARLDRAQSGIFSDRMEGARNLKRELVTVTKHSGQQVAYYHTRYTTSDRYTTKKNQRNFMRFTSFIGAGGEVKDVVKGSTTKRTIDIAISDTGLKKVAEIATRQPDRLAQAFAKAYTSIKPYKRGSRAWQQVPWLHPNAQKRAQAIRLLQQYDSHPDPENRSDSEYWSLTRGWNLQKDAQAYKQYKRLNGLIGQLAGAGTAKARAQIFAKAKWLSIDNFWVGSATVAKVAGMNNIKTDISIKGENNKPVYLYQSAAAEKIVDPQGRINHVMLYPTEAN